jgi:hypothetical protein
VAASAARHPHWQLSDTGQFSHDSTLWESRWGKSRSCYAKSVRPPIWLAMHYVPLGEWTLSRMSFSDEAITAKFAADIQGMAFFWTHVLNFAHRPLTPVSAYGFGRKRKTASV